MDGAQRFPSIAVREVDGFREGLNPSALRFNYSDFRLAEPPQSFDIIKCSP
jgi:hypothetical protein